MRALLSKWNNFLFEPDSPFNLGVLRFIVFTVGSTFFAFKMEAHVPTFFDKWTPISYYQLLSGPVSDLTLNVLLWTWLLFTWVAGFGVLYRFLAPVGVLSGMFYLGHEYNFGQVYHSRHMYIMAALILAFSNADRGFHFWRTDFSEISSAYRWPIRWIQLYVVYVMFITGVEKLYYGGPIQWAFSDTFYLRLFLTPDPSWVNRWIIEQPIEVSQILAGFALYVVEFAAPLAFLNKRLSYFFVFVWSCFHVMVTLTLGNHYLFYSQILAYMSFIDWSIFVPLKSPVVPLREVTRSKKRLVSAFIILFLGFSFFQLVGWHREDFPFTWFGMFNGNVSNRDVYLYSFTYEAPGDSPINLFTAGNGYNLDYQFNQSLRGLSLDFNNTILAPAAKPILSNQNLKRVELVMRTAAESVLQREKVVPAEGSKLVLSYRYWKLLTPEVRNFPSERVTVLEIPANK